MTAENLVDQTVFKTAVKGAIKRRSDTVDSNLRREEKIRFGDENAVDGETRNGVVRDHDRVSGEESREGRERLQETEIGEGETLRNDVISDWETTTVGGGWGEIGGVEVGGDENGGGERDADLVFGGEEEIGGPVAEVACSDHRLDDSVGV